MKITVCPIPGVPTKHEVPDDATIFSIWPLLTEIAHEWAPGEVVQLHLAGKSRTHFPPLKDGNAILLTKGRVRGCGPSPRPANIFLIHGVYIEPFHIQSPHCECRECQPYLYRLEPSKTFVVRYGNYPPPVTVGDMKDTFEYWRRQACATKPHRLHINNVPCNDETYVIQHGDRIDFIEGDT